MLTGDQALLSEEVNKLVHLGRKKDAAQLICNALRWDMKVKNDRPADYNPPLQTYLMWLLNNKGMEEAAQLLWTPIQFNPNPQSVFDIWNLFDTSTTGLLMGAGSMSKSYSMGVRLFLEWIRDPQNTTIRLLGPSADHLESNLFSHMVQLHSNATIPMPGKVGSLFIGLDRRNLVSSIKGIVIPVGNVKKAGRLQGTKRKPRRTSHPDFGDLTRLFIFLDEIENIPTGIWSDIDNLLSNLEQVDSVGLKIFGAYNPSNQFDEVGIRAEPEFGWNEFDLDKHFRWKSKRGWDVLRLDGERSENVITETVLYPGLQTRAGLDRIASNAGGVLSAGYLTMGRGAYPTQGLESTVIPAGMIAASRGEFIFIDTPKPVGSVDMALEGKHSATATVGRAGMASGIKYPPSIEHPTGHTVMFKGPDGVVVPRLGLQADQQFPLPKGSTRPMTDATLGFARKAGIRPELLCLDRTGNGAGVHDLLKSEWSSLVIGVNYSSSTTTMKVMEEDLKAANEEYDRIDSELWFATRGWLEFKVLLINPAMDLSSLTPQLTRRRYRVTGGKRKVESKSDYKRREKDGSPDEADSITLFVHAARVGMQIVPSMKSGASGMGPDSDDWWGGNYYPGGTRVDPSNQTDTLEVT